MDGAFKGCWRNAGHLRQNILWEGWKWNLKKDIWCCTHILLTSCFHVLIPRNTSILKTYWISLTLFESARALFAWQTLQNLKRNNTAVFLCDTRHYSSVLLTKQKSWVVSGNIQMSKYDRQLFFKNLSLIKAFFLQWNKNQRNNNETKMFWPDTAADVSLKLSLWPHHTDLRES